MTVWKKAIAGFVAIAILSFFGFQIGVPYLIMSRAISGVARQAGGFNTPLATGLPTAAVRNIVKPSPDLLYTACAFDLSDGPVLIGGTPSAAYWSMALYGSNTDNFFVINDRQADNKPAFVVLATAAMRAQIPAAYRSLTVVEPPSRKGVALFRYLVLDQKDLAATAEVQASAVCRRI
jgi:uncharacterized membrane protein